MTDRATESVVHMHVLTYCTLRPAAPAARTHARMDVEMMEQRVMLLTLKLETREVAAHRLLVRWS